MAQTDRQTDTTARASLWSVTAWDDAIIKLQKPECWPTWLRKVWGGIEECPTTGKPHHQGLLETMQIRFSSLKQFLGPDAHIEVCRDRNKLKSYVMKKETAIGEKKCIEAEKNYFSMDDLLIELAISNNELDRNSYKIKGPHDIMLPPDEETIYWVLVQKVLKKHGRHLASSLANPAIRKMWINTKDFWVEAAHSITGSPDNEVENEIVQV